MSGLMLPKGRSIEVIESNENADLIDGFTSYYQNIGEKYEKNFRTGSNLYIIIYNNYEFSAMESNYFQQC